MSARQRFTSENLAQLIKDQLEAGKCVEIDGLGSFRPDGSGAFHFIGESEPRVFIAYAAEDRMLALRLYRDLERAGLRPWIDKRKLMPGQNWPRAIEHAISISHYFIACFSAESVSKPGYFHSELRFALECAERMPLDGIYLIPVRLDECRVPSRIAASLQYVDLFPDWPSGVAALIAAMRAGPLRLAS
jgi:hypothetical protein